MIQYSTDLMWEPMENPSSSLCSGNIDYAKPCWYWNKKDLEHTPSQLEGIQTVTEARYRREGARFIFNLGKCLGLHYDTLATGIIYFHRFYMFHSYKQFPRYVTGACCLFLAGKVEETPKKCKDIIKTARSLLTDVQFSQFGNDPKEEVIALEAMLLQTIKFDLQVEHPYRFLLKYVKQLKGGKDTIQKLVQMAWTFINDSLCTTLSLQWEPEIIAIAVIYLAGRLCKFEIQEKTSKPVDRIWWEQFVEDLQVDVLEDICHQILDSYSQGKQQMPHHTDLTPPVLHTQQSSLIQLQPQQQPQSLDAQETQSEESKHLSLQTQQALLHVQPANIPSLQPTLLHSMKPPEITSPKEESKLCAREEKSTSSLLPTTATTDYPKEPPQKMSKLETTHQQILPVHPPPDCEPPLVTITSAGEGHQTVDAGEISKIQIPHVSHSAIVNSPLLLSHCPSPPPPDIYITGMSSTKSCMSGNGYQSLQSMLKPEGSSYGFLPPSLRLPSDYNFPCHPRGYSTYTPRPVPSPSNFFPSNTSPNPGYPPLPSYNPNLSTPQMPPTQSPPAMGMPIFNYTAPAFTAGGLPQLPPPIKSLNMPPLGDWDFVLR